MGQKWMMVMAAWLMLAVFVAPANAGYIDNGNGTVTDTATGLTWQTATASETCTWEQALAYCENLTLAGHSDWRLPTIKELDSIVDLSIPYPGPTINTTYFPNTAASWYWSSTTYASDTYGAWGVDFNGGYGNSSYKYVSGYVRAVRGGQSGSLGNLVIAQTPMSGPPGTTFTEWGTGFTPSSTATLHFKKPDGTEYPTLAQPIDAFGHFEITYDAPFDKPAGIYTWWAVDGSTHQTSNTISYIIEGEPGKLHHFEFSSISDQAAGVLFPVQIEAKDDSGNRVTSFSENVSLFHNGPGTLSPEWVHLEGGYASFSLKISQPNVASVIYCQYAGVNGQSNTFAITGGSGKTGTIRGFVEGPIPTIDVILAQTPYKGPITMRVTALSDGQYILPGVSAGSYYVWAVDSENKSSVAQSVKIESGQTVQAPDLRIHSKKQPVILVPGIMGTTKKWVPPTSLYPTLPQKMPADPSDLQIHDPGSIIPGYAGAVGWKYLSDQLKDNYEIYECPYDWRVSLMSGSDTYKKYLLPVIKKAKEDTGWEKVDIVAHSMGGLMVRSYIQSDDYNNDIDKFAMVGTPNNGSLLAYNMWEGGDTMLTDQRAEGTTGIAPYFYSHVADNLYRALYDKPLFEYVELYTINGPINTDIPKKMLISNQEARSFIWGYCPSIWQLMPIFDNCLSEDGNSKNIETWRNQWLINLNNDSGRLSLIQTTGPIQTRIFASDSENTLSQLYVKKSTISGIYEDGMDRVDKSPEKEPGDGTVLETSALLGGVTPPAKAKGEHRSLIKENTDDIVSFLNEGRTFAKTQMLRQASLQETYSASLGVSVSGPPSVLITDPSGARCGIDQGVGEIYEEIAGSKTIGESGNFMASMPDPVEGSFTVKLSGSTAGNATITLSMLTEDKTDEKRFLLYYPGSPLTFTFTLASSSTPMIQITGLPAAPTGLIGAANGPNTRLNWQAPAGQTVVGYRIYARNDNEPDLQYLASVAGNLTQYDTSDPWNAPGRDYAVSTIDGQGHESVLSNIADNKNHLLADFDATPKTGAFPLGVQFTDTSTGSPTAWEWDFGDGGTSTEQNPAHTYTGPGIYTVSLTVTDADGHQDVENKSDLINIKQLDPSLATVQKLFIGYYLRPAAPAGLVYWAGRWADEEANPDGNIKNVIEAFANTPESQAIWGGITEANIEAFINKAFQSLFGRDAAPYGLNFYHTGFTNGTFTPGTIVYDIFVGAPDGSHDKAVLDKKLAFADAFTSILEPVPDDNPLNDQATYKGQADAAIARGMLAAVGEYTVIDPAAIEQQIKDQIADPGDPILN